MKKKTLSVAAAALAAVMLTTGCGQTASSVASSAAASSEIASSVAESTVSAEETSYPLTLQIYDADGNAVDMTYDHAPEKVLSTQLSMTELLIKLGLKDKIVGVFDNDNALKGDIADEVASLNSLGDKKSVSKETILATEPDLILGKGPLMFTESSIGTVQSYQELGIPVYTELASASTDQALDNIVEDVRNIGEIFNVQETANAYADELQERIDALMDKVSGQSGEPLKVLFMAGYADGTFVAFNSKMSSCMLNALNAENVLDKGGNGLTLHLDFLPGWSREDTLTWLERQRTVLSRQEAGALLTGGVHPRLGRMLCKAAGISGSQPVSELTDRQLEALCRQVREFTLPITGTCGFDQAQVTAGGLRTGEFDPRTMESRLVPGFYACGEVLDIDGDCGGFNLQWAWASGRLAGRLLHI